MRFFGFILMCAFRDTVQGQVTFIMCIKDLKIKEKY